MAATDEEEQRDSARREERHGEEAHGQEAHGKEARGEEGRGEEAHGEEGRVPESRDDEALGSEDRVPTPCETREAPELTSSAVNAESGALFADYWHGVRARTRRVALHIPTDRVEWTHAPGKWTLGDLVRHLGAIERFMYGETVQGSPSAYPGHGRDLADGLEATLAYLDRCHADSLAIFRTLDAAALSAKCLTPAGTPITVWKWLRAMVEHEAHHRGQIFLMLGMLGVATEPLYGLTEEEVRAMSSRGR